jgi:predicted dehydrogenase
MSTIGVAIIGAGAIALANHVPGLKYCPDTRLVALCDTDPRILEAAGRQTGITALHAHHRDAIARDDVHAVIVTTPNFVHAPIVLDAVNAGRHVLCEKPLAMSHPESLRMLQAARRAGVRHMTAFTYRFVPAMAYMRHLVKKGVIGRPYHFRAQRFQDWGSRPVGWRQFAKYAGTGEMGDMLSHRIDYGQCLLGPMARVVAHTRRFLDLREGLPSDVEDWVAMIADFETGATGVLESTKLASGRGEGGNSRDYCEVNGSEASIVYYLDRPLELYMQRAGAAGLQPAPVPQEFRKHPASTRNPDEGDAIITFRYDQDAEFIDAIRNGRECTPSFADGARVQAVMDAALESVRFGRWVDIPRVE